MLGNFEIKQRDLNLDQSIINTNDLSSIASVLFCTVDFQFNTLADFNTTSVWLAAIANQYVFPLHNLTESTENSEETELENSRQNYRFVKREGKYRFMLGLTCDIDYFIRLKEYEGRNLKCYLWDINNNLIGLRSGNTVLPFGIESLIISKPKFGTAAAGWTNVYLDLYDNLESGYFIKPTWDVESLVNINVDFENIAQTDSDTMTFDVIDTCSEGIEGLLAANFTITDNINGAIAISLLTDLGGGSYRIDGAEQFYSGQIKLVSTKYNALGTYEFTVPEFNPLQFSNEFNIT